MLYYYVLFLVVLIRAMTLMYNYDAGILIDKIQMLLH